MRIPLNSFEEYIDETILERGLQYFKKGLVSEPELISQGEFEFRVDGTETYTVKLKLYNNEVYEFACTCPYDFGPVCKHVVATIFYLQKDELNLEVKEKSKKKNKSKSSKKTLVEQVDEILEIMTSDELKDYIREECASDRSFRQLFLAKQAYRVIPESKELYKKQLKAVLQEAKGRKGYIDYYEARNVGNHVYDMLDNAERMLEDGNVLNAMYMAMAMVEEMVKALMVNEKDVAYCEIKSSYGHDAFLLEEKQITRLIKNFLPAR